MKKFFLKKFIGIRIITWFNFIPEIGITALTIFYFGKNNDLKEKGLPDRVVYFLILCLILIAICKLYLEFYENRIKDSFVDPEEILNSLYKYLNFEHDDVKLTLYKVLNDGEKRKSKGIQKLGQIVHGKSIEIEMDDFYPRYHLASAIQHSPDYDYFEVRNITNPDFSQFKERIGYSESFMNLYTNKIPKYWFYQLFKTRKHEVSLVLIIESVQPIKYYDTTRVETIKVSNKEEAKKLYNFIKESMLLESLIHGK